MYAWESSKTKHFGFHLMKDKKKTVNLSTFGVAWMTHPLQIWLQNFITCLVIKIVQNPTALQSLLWVEEEGRAVSLLYEWCVHVEWSDQEHSTGSSVVSIESGRRMGFVHVTLLKRATCQLLVPYGHRLWWFSFCSSAPSCQIRWTLLILISVI